MLNKRTLSSIKFMYFKKIWLGIQFFFIYLKFLLIVYFINSTLCNIIHVDILIKRIMSFLPSTYSNNIIYPLKF